MLMLQRQSSRRKTEWLAYNNTTASTVTYIRCLHLHTTDAKKQVSGAANMLVTTESTILFISSTLLATPTAALHCVLLLLCYAF